MHGQRPEYTVHLNDYRFDSGNLSIIEFKNQVWNLLHNLLVLIGELILILGSKIHNFLAIFGVAPKFHSKLNQKLGFLKV